MEDFIVTLNEATARLLDALMRHRGLATRSEAIESALIDAFKSDRNDGPGAEINGDTYAPLLASFEDYQRDLERRIGQKQ